jgi:hypothetical protein
MKDTLIRKLTSVKLWILVATLAQFNGAAYFGFLDGQTYVGAILGAFAIYTGGNISSKFAFARLTEAAPGQMSGGEEVHYVGESD